MPSIFKKSPSNHKPLNKELDLLLGKIENLKRIKNIDSIFEAVSSGLQELDINPIISIIDNNKTSVYIRHTGLSPSLENILKIKFKEKIAISDLKYDELNIREVVFKKQRFKQLKKIFQINELPEDLKNINSIFVPLILRGETIGFLEVLSPHLSESDSAVIFDFAKKLVVRIANTILFQEVYKSENKYRSLFEGANEGFFVLNGKLKKLTDVNKKLCNISGYTRDELLQKSFLLLFDEPERKKVERYINDIVQSAEIYKEISQDDSKITCETVMITKTGAKRYVRMSVIQITKEDEWFIILQDISKTKEAEDALKDSEEKYRKLVNNANETVITINREGFIDFANSYFYKMTGYSKNDKKQLHFKQIVHPEDFHILTKIFNSSENTKITATNDLRIITKFGEIKNISLSTSPIIKNDELTGIQAIARDVTENRKLTKIIEDSKNHYEQILDTIQDSIIVLNRQHDILRCNSSFANKVNMSISKIIGKKCFQVVPKYENGLFKNHCFAFKKNEQCKVTQALDSGVSLIFIEKNKDKNNNVKYHKISVFSAKNSKGEVYQTVIAIRDVTESEASAEKIRKLSEFNKRILNNVPVSILTLDKNGIITSSNNFIKTISGHDNYEGRSIFDLGFTQKENLKQKYENLLKNGISFVKDNCVYHNHKTRSKKYLNITAEPLFDNEGKVDGAISMAIDNTESVLVKEKIEELNRDLERKVIQRTRQLDAVNKELNTVLDLKSKFISDASHELRTPLTIIQGNLELSIHEKQMKGEEIPEMYTLINKEIQRMTGILSDLTLLTNVDSNSESIYSQDVDLEELITATGKSLEILARQKNIKIKIKKKYKSVFIKGDETKLEKLFINIIRNAIKYTDENGIVKLSVEKGNSEARVIIEDNGMGIPDQDLPYIFERFYRVDKARSRNEGGTGLGLSICKWIVEAHKGYIAVESQLGKGSKFTVHLPYNFKEQRIF